MVGVLVTLVVTVVVVSVVVGEVLGEDVADVVGVLVAVEVPVDVGVVIWHVSMVPSTYASVALLIADAAVRHSTPVCSVFPWPKVLIMSSSVHSKSAVTSPRVTSLTTWFKRCMELVQLSFETTVNPTLVPALFEIWMPHFNEASSAPHASNSGFKTLSWTSHTCFVGNVR